MATKTGSTHAERVADRQVRTATLLMDLAAQAGVSRSPSEVRYEIARILGSACSQSTVTRLHLALEATSVGRARKAR